MRDYHIKNSNLLKNFALQSQGALGTRQIYFRQEALAFIGDRAAVGKTTAFGQLGNDVEFYGYAGVGVEYVFLNALIQGHPFGDNSPFTLPIEPLVFSFKMGATYRDTRNSYQVIYKYRTRETSREGRSQFVTFQYARQF